MEEPKEGKGNQRRELGCTCIWIAAPPPLSCEALGEQLKPAEASASWCTDWDCSHLCLTGSLRRPASKFILTSFAVKGLDPSSWSLAGTGLDVRGGSTVLGTARAVLSLVPALRVKAILPIPVSSDSSVSSMKIHMWCLHNHLIGKELLLSPTYREEDWGSGKSKLSNTKETQTAPAPDLSSAAQKPLLFLPMAAKTPSLRFSITSGLTLGALLSPLVGGSHPSPSSLLQSSKQSSNWKGHSCSQHFLKIQPLWGYFLPENGDITSIYFTQLL